MKKVTSIDDFPWNEDQVKAWELMSNKNIRDILFYGGSRSGKTFLTCAVIVARCLAYPGSRHLILRKTFKSLKGSIGKDTLPNVIRTLFSRYVNVSDVLNKTEFEFAFPNGSTIELLGLDYHIDKILGREYSTIYFNEASEIDYDVFEHCITRLAQRVKSADGSTDCIKRVFVDENPPTIHHWTYKHFIKKVNPVTNKPLTGLLDSIGVQKLRTQSNVAHLGDEYIDRLRSQSDANVKRFLDGDFSSGDENALFKAEDINSNRIFGIDDIAIYSNKTIYDKIIIGVDPAVTANAKSDETGIIIVGVKKVDNREHYYVLDDVTGKYTPQVWAEKVVDAYNEWQANEVVAEVNQGGDLVESNILTINPCINVKKVRATRGKDVRAEPVASLYRNGYVHHVGEIPNLEVELISWVPGVSTKSPNRIDALVWAISSTFKQNNDDTSGWKGKKVWGGKFFCS